MTLASLWRTQRPRKRLPAWGRIAVVLVAASLFACGPGSDKRPGLGDALSPDLERRLAESRFDAEMLNGLDPPNQEMIAELALERAGLGARWLANVVKEDGSFFYRYFPETDEYDKKTYNEVRHAGVTYSMFQAYGATKDEDVRTAAETAKRYIDNNSLRTPDGSGRAFAFEGTAKLGGQALALVALLEGRRVTQDTRSDGLIHDLALFVRSLKVSETPGRYYQSYNVQTGQRSLEPDSEYYPSENLLALVRLEQQFPGRGFLEEAVQTAYYLLKMRDGDLPELGKIPREDHWLSLALPELNVLNPDEDYLAVERLQAESMARNQHGPDQPFPDRIGASSTRSPVNYTSTATKGEALVAAWGMFKSAGNEALEKRFSEAALRNLQFQMRTQYLPRNSQLFPAPQRAIGAWGKDATETYVRIDFVQHNISGLIGGWHLIEEGKLPIAEPLSGRR